MGDGRRRQVTEGEAAQEWRAFERARMRTFEVFGTFFTWTKRTAPLQLTETLQGLPPPAPLVLRLGNTLSISVRLVTTPATSLPRAAIPVVTTLPPVVQVPEAVAPFN